MTKSIHLFVIGVLCIGVTTSMGQLNHRYSFNNDGLAEDSVGLADGTIVGDASVSGGQAVLNFGARDGTIDLGGGAIGINTYSSLTLEVWATPSSSLNDSFSSLLGFGRPDPGNPGIFNRYVILQTHRNDNVSRVSISLSDDGSPWDEEDGANGAELNDNEEHQYVGVIDATSISLYIDGAFVSSSPLANVLPNGLSGLATDQALIGDAYANDQNWAGSVNEVRIYGNPLPDFAIAANFAAGPDGQITVPEPSAFVLSGLGILGLLMRRRRF